ncbi:hypothetical protein [Ochrobactrum soli]|uniref:Uncharacterized protein n=1 Tax=Ochrobactrum soli TaxID=2448455 RepID=A0A849KWR5_9HYPH|nr:hypothetical protein [[Ochrobactrum] soli]NNU63609.1 hypothetical protein [[Ochrobactrum] soli]
MITDNRQSPRVRKYIKWTGTAVLLLSVTVAALFYFRDILPAIGSSTAAESQTTKSDRPIKGDTPFHKHIAEAGLTACASAFPAMGEMLTQNAQYMVQTKWNREQPEKHVIEGLVGMQFDSPDHKGPAIGYVFAAPIAGACDGGMVRVVPFAKNCDSVAQQFLPGSRLAGELQGLRTYVAQDGSEIVVMPVGENCVSVSLGNMPS